MGVNKPVTDEFLRTMARGVHIHRQLTKPCKVSRLAKYGFRITLTQGLNRQIRLMSEALGYKVVQLRRVRVINVQPRHSQARRLAQPERRRAGRPAARFQGLVAGFGRDFANSAIAVFAPATTLAGPAERPCAAFNSRLFP